jgi:catechol 2,3-dioxygenase-like lactoylglutathione lyase family enzyme
VKIDLLDHVALRVPDRGELTEFLTVHLGLRVIEETERFTLVGADAKLGKLTLFDAAEPRGIPPLERIVLRVPNRESVLALLPPDLPVEEHGGETRFEAPGSLPLALVERPDTPACDLERVVLRAHHPMSVTNELRHLGFDTRDHHVVAGTTTVELVGADPGDPRRSLLDHLGLLVQSADEHIAEAEDRGLEIDDVVETENTRSLFVFGPEGLRLEYVEHLPTFSLV